MDTYQVGTNAPIKVKTGIATEGTAFTFVLLNDPNNPGNFTADFAYVITPSTGRRQIANGAALQGRTLRVKTLVDFFVNFPDEATFNLAVERAKNSYTAQLFGGTPIEIDTNFQVFPNFARNGVEFFGEISLT